MNSNEKCRQLAESAAHYMEYGQQLVYIVAGAGFFLIGIALLVYSPIQFFHEAQTDYMHAFYLLLNDLMLLLILMESIESIVYFLKYQTTPLKPFLHMGIIAAVRKILGAGAKVVLVENMSQAIFERYLFDLGINALVILAIAISLMLLYKKSEALEE